MKEEYQGIEEKCEGKHGLRWPFLGHRLSVS